MKASKILAVFGSILLLAMVAAIACSSDEDESAPAAAGAPAVAPPPPPPAAAPAPAASAGVEVRPAVPTGTLKAAWASFGHNTMKVYQDGHWVAIPIYDPVMAKDSKLLNTPGVVESWSNNSDFTSFTLKLREDVKFHDGSIADSTDLHESMALWLRPETSGGTVRYLQTHVTEMKIVDGLTVQADFDTPTLGFVKEMMTLSQPTLLIHAESLQEFGLEDAFVNPIGTGPFTYKSFTASSDASYEAFPDYWGDGPYWDRLEMVLVTEDATRLALLLTGQTDMIDGSVLIVDALIKGKVKVTTTPPSVSTWGWFGNTWEPGDPNYTEDMPWFTPEARMAFNLAIDREKLLDEVYRGYAIADLTPVLMPGSTGYEQAKAIITPYAFDPARARELLRAAGVPEGTEITVKHSRAAGGAPEMATTVTAVAAMWEENLGLKVNVVSQSGNVEMFPILEKKGDWPYITFLRSIPSQFPETTFGYFMPEYAQYRNYFAEGGQPLIDLVSNMTEELDWPTRQQKSAQVSKFLADNHAYIGLVVNPFYYGVSKRVGEWPLTPGTQFGHNYNFITHGE